MGRHKDRISQDFINLLKTLGKMYNFFVQEEYPLVKDEFYADIVWKLSEDQAPIISFEVESGKTPYLINNAAKYFSTYSRDISKPWQHFIIILRGKLSEGTKKLLRGITEKHNVHIFENVLEDEKEDNRLKEILGKIAQGISTMEAQKKTSNDFQKNFSIAVDEFVRLKEQKAFQSTIEANDAIDMLIMQVKGQIERWDVPSVRFATRELFIKLYVFSEENEFCELYTIFKDLFAYAYSQRKHLIGTMMEVFDTLMWFESWVKGYDVEKGEKAAKVLLRLGIDFILKDLSITRDCFTSIDNLASDMFEPEILSKEILLGTSIFQKAIKNPKNLELRNLVEELVDWVRVNDEYSWDAEIRTYLRDSIKYAEWEQEKYGIDIEPFKHQFLLPALEVNIGMEIEEYTQFLEDLLNEGADGTEDTFPAEDLSKMILAYEFLRPGFAYELEEKIIKANKPHITELFKRIVNNSNFLRKIYGKSEMITTFDELIKFLEQSSDIENLEVGVTAYSLAMIDFQRRLKQNEKEALRKMMQKYGIQDELEISDEGIQFEIDHLVYLGNGRYDMKKLIDLLKEINAKFKVKRFSTGIDFNLRET
jgi:uncharacterized tellurite resistance protein B-like protein